MLRPNSPTLRPAATQAESIGMDGQSTAQSTAQSESRPGKFHSIGVVLTLIAFIAFGVVLWEEGLKDRVRKKKLGLVEPRLWRSGQISRFMIGPTLSQVSPDLIVSMSYDNPENPHNMAEFEAAKALGIRRQHVNLSGDGTGDPGEYVDAVQWIVEALQRDETVLVHCWAGTERTSGVVSLYRVLFRGESPADAVTHMRGYGHDVDEGVLINYLNQNIGAIAAALVERGVLDRIPDPLPVFPDAS